MGTGIIVGMCVIAVGSAIAEKVLESAGKNNYAEYLRIASISLGATTVIGIFMTFIKALRTMI